MTALNVQKPCKKSPFPRNNHNLWIPRRMVLLSILEAKEITSKKAKDKKLSTQEKKRKSFSRTVTGRALPRSASVAPLRRRLLDRGLLLEALRLRQRGRDQSHRRATNGARSHRTIAADSGPHRTQRCPSLSPTLADLVNHFLPALRLVYFLHLIRPCDMRGGFQNCSHQSHKRMF